VATFHFVLVGWVFFRASSLSTAWSIFRQVGSFKYSFDNATPAYLGVLGIAALGHYVPDSWFRGGLEGFAKTPALVQAAGLALLVAGIRFVAAAGAAPFIYSRF
jgi:hypothetical protein